MSARATAPADAATAPAAPTTLEVDALTRIPLFRGVDTNVVAPLLRNCETASIEAGEPLIEAGRPNEKLYILLEGRLSVRLKSPDSQPLAYVEPGETVGELSLIDHQPTSASVMAETTSRVLVLDEPLVWMLTNTSHAVSGNLLFALVKRLRAGNDMVWESRERVEQYRFHATVDALTGLFNRHWLNQMLPRQMHRAATSGEGLSLIMIDIDHFKQYNDSHGHPAGDQALRKVADAIRDHVRPADMAARYGGEELLVILPACVLAGARVVAERLRRALHATAIVSSCGTELPRVTASFGIAEMAPDASMQDFVSACDRALYRAKAAGRDCVCD